MKRYIHSTDNSDTYVMYVYYDHLILRRTGETKVVEKAIRNHDFDTFMKLYNKYPPYVSRDGASEVFFPDVAYIKNMDGETIGELDITTPEGFNQIDDVDYECG